MNIDNIQCSKGRITALCKTIINKKKYVTCLVQHGRAAII